MPRKPLATVYGRLTVLSVEGEYATCLCSCGKSAPRRVATGSLRSGATTSCGCRSREVVAQRNAASATHRQTKTAMYQTWKGMLDRCRNPNNEHFSDYGGRGILVCPEWETNFERFLSDVGPKPSALHTLDRMDTDGPYSPSNCRWATRVEQARNRRNGVYVEHGGVRMLLIEWCEKFGCDYYRARARIFDCGWPFELALFAPKGTILKKWRQIAWIPDDFPGGAAA